MQSKRKLVKSIQLYLLKRVLISLAFYRGGDGAACKMFSYTRVRLQAPKQSTLTGFALVLVIIAGMAVSFWRPMQTEAATTSTINFQARLETSAGSIVPDGNYNVQFKLYSASSGGSALWTESYLNSATQGVTVVGGYLSVNLGSVTAFPGTINWDQDLWLTMNIGGTTAGAPSYDGEMNPRLKLTALPYAFRAGQLAKLSGANTSTLDFAAQTGARSLLLPDENGTLCIQNSTNCGFAATTGGTGYIQNGTSTQINANFAIQSAATGSITAALKAISSQTADLLQLQNSSGNRITGFDSAGKLQFANGAGGAYDANLYRLANNTLRSDDSLLVQGNGAGPAFQAGTITYNTGTIQQTGNAITGAGTTFNSDMVGGTIVYSDGATGTITAFGSTTTLTSSVSKSVAALSSYTIYYGGLSVASTGVTSQVDLMLGTGDQIDFFDEVGDKVYWYSNAYGTGVESGTLTNWSQTRFRWRIGGTSVSGGTGTMNLTSTGLRVGDNTDATAALDIIGSAKVSGSGKTALQLTATTADTGITLGGDTTLYRSTSNMLKTDGSLIVSGDLTVGTSNSSNGTFTTNSFNRTVPTTVNNEVDLGTYAVTGGNGATQLDITVSVSNSGFSVNKRYIVPIQYNATNNVWQTLMPVTDTGPYSSNDFAIDVNVSNANTSLRLRRTAGSTAGTASVQIIQTGAASTFTGSSSVAAVSAPAALYGGTALTQAGGSVGFGVQPANGTGLIQVGAASSTGAANGILIGGDVNLFRSNTNELTTNSDILIQGGDLLTNQTTFNLLNTTATTINFGGAVGSGGIVFAGGSGSTGCTLDGSTGNLACSGNITGATTGTQGYWSRSGTTLQPSNNGDSVTTSGNISTSGSGIITSAGELRGNAGLRVYGGPIKFSQGTTDLGVQAFGKTPLLMLNGEGSTNNGPNIGLLQYNISGAALVGGQSQQPYQSASEVYLGATRSDPASPGTRIAVGNQDILGLLGFYGDDGTNIRTRGAFIRSMVDTTNLAVSTGVIPARLEIATTSQAPITFSTQAGAPGSGFAGNERMRIESNGNVGIATSSPTTGKLQVNGLTAIGNAFTNKQNTSGIVLGNGTQGIEFMGPAGTNGYSHQIAEVDTGTGSSNLTVSRRNDSASFTSQLVLSSLGNIGIGTASNVAPASLLQLGSSAGTNTSGITFGSGTTPDTNLYRSAADNLKTDDTFDAAAYKVGGTAGASVACTGGQVLQNSTIAGGIVTAGSCSAINNPDLQYVYNNGSQITLNSTQTGVKIQDAASAIGGNLLQVTSNGGGTAYLAVTSAGVSTSGTLTAASNVISTGGGIYTGGSIAANQRIDSTGNLLNIGNITTTGNSTLTVGGTGNSLIIKPNAGNSATFFQIQNANGYASFIADNAYTPGSSTIANLVTNPGFEVDTSGWATGTTMAVTRVTTNSYSGVASAQAVTSVANQVARYTFGSTQASASYIISFYARASGSNVSTINLGYNNGTTDTDCLTGQTAVTTGWNRYSCTITSAITSIYIKNTAAAGTIFIDGVQMETGNITPYNFGTALQLRGVIESPVTFRAKENSTSAFQVQNATGNGNNFVVDTLNSRVNFLTSGYGANFNSAGTAIFRTTANSTTGFQVQNASGWQIFNVDTVTPTNMINNPGFEINNTGWAGKNGAAAPTRITSPSTSLYYGVAAGSLAMTAANHGTSFNVAMTLGQTYTLSFYAKANSGTYTNIQAGYVNASAADVNCFGSDQTVVSTGFTRYTCSFTVAGTGNATAIYVKQTGATSQTLLIDGFQLLNAGSAQPYSLGNIALRGAINNPALFKSTSDSTTAFQIQDAAGNSNLFVADTLNDRIGIGTASPSFALDVVGNVNGAHRASVRNTNAGSSAFSSFTIGNDTAQVAGGIFYGSSTYSGYGGNSSLNLINVLNAPLTIGTNNAVILTMQGTTSTFAGAVALNTLGTTNTSALLCRNSTNQIAGCNTTGNGAAFVQGGNSFGATAVLGTNDSFDLLFRTAGTTALTLDTSNNATLAGNLIVQGTGISTIAGALTISGPTTVSNSTSSTPLLVSGDATAVRYIEIKNTGNNQAGVRWTSGSTPLQWVAYVQAPTNNWRLWSGTLGSDALVVTSAGQLQVPTQGASGGILLGGDANLYRSGSNVLKTDDTLTVSPASFAPGSSGNAPALALQAGSNSNVFGNAQITFGYDNTDNYRSSISTRSNAGGQAGNAIDFYVWDQTTDAVGSLGSKQVMTLDGNGRVGLNGITSPTAALSLQAGTTAAEGLAFGTDTNLYRPAANQLKTDDSIAAVQGFRAEGFGNFTAGAGLEMQYGNPGGGAGGVLFAYDRTNSLAKDLYLQHTGGKIGIGITTAPTALLSLKSGTTAADGIAFGTDTSLYRSAADTLKTDDALVVQGVTTVNTLGTTNTSALLCRNSTNQIAGCNTTGNGAAFVQGGNSFGAQAVLGTNDNNSLAFRTNNGNKLVLDTSGNLQFQQASTLSTSSGNFTLNAGGANSLILQTNGTAALTLDSSSNATFAGNLTYSGSLATGAISQIDPIVIRGTGLNNNAARLVKVGNTTYVNGTGRGLNLVIINKSDHSLVSQTTYDTYGVAANSDSLATALNGVTNSQIGVLTSNDAWEGAAITTNLRNAFQRLGLTKALAISGGSRVPYAAIFEGSSSSTVNSSKVVETTYSSDLNQPYAELRGWLTDGSFDVGGATGQNALFTPRGDSIALFVNNSGNIGIGTTAPAALLDVNGTLSVTNTATFGTLGTTNTSAYLCLNSSNQLAACATTGNGAVFVQGGNSFGAAAVLGTNDNNSLQFRTNGTTALTLDTSNNATFAGNATASGTVQGTSLIATVATGTAPLTVTSTTMVNNLNVERLGGYTENQIASNLRSNVNITGGGTVTWDSSSNLSWSQRMIVIDNGNGSDFSTAGYFDITQPPNGTVITGVGGATNVTVGASGIPMSTAWTALYYILPIGSGSGTVNGNFRVALYGSALKIPSNWVLIAVRNNDNTTLRLSLGQTLRQGQSITAGSINNAAFNTSVTTPLVQNAGTLTLAATGANSILLQTNGTTALTVSSSGNVDIAGNILGNGKNAIQTNDTWLRLNNSNQFTSGVYTPGGLRVDGNFNINTSTVITSGRLIQNILGYTQSSGSATFNQNAADQFRVVALQAPTSDMVQITNAGFPIATDGINGQQIDYYAALANATHQVSAQRINITNTSATAGSVTNGLRIVATGAVAGTTNGLKIDNFTSGAGGASALYLGSGWKDLISLNGSQLLSGAGKLQDAAIDSAVTYTNLQKVGTINTGTWQGTAVAAGFGGTGQSSYTTGDMLYASGAATLSKLAAVATGNVLISGGTGTAPSWGKVGLTTHVTGTLAYGNGGTGSTSYTTNGVVYAGATGLQSTAVGTTGQCLIGNTGAAPSWGTCAGASSTTLQGAYDNDATGEADIVTTSTSKKILFKAGSGFDSNSLFHVQNAAGSDLFIVDSSNTRIQIGSATADTTGVLLVLDTKNNAGDPTGVDGGMYYNSSMKRFRCYEDGDWLDCNAPNDLKKQWFIYEDWIANNNSLGGNDLGDNNWTAFSTLNTSLAADGDLDMVAADTSDRLGVMRFKCNQSGGACKVNGGVAVRLGEDSIVGMPAGLYTEFDWKSVTDNSNQIIRIGLHRFRTASIPGGGITNSAGMWFEFNTATDATNWLRCTANSSGTTCTSTGIAKAAVNTNQSFRIYVNSSSQVDFFIDGSSAGSNTTNLPGSTDSYGPNLQALTTNTTFRAWETDYFQLRRSNLSR